MIDRFEAWLRRWRTRISRSEWSIRKLGLAVSDQTEAEPGLVLIEVEDFLHGEIRHALAAGKAPFVARLIAVEGYRLDRLDPGPVPTHTAHTHELFFGPSGEAIGGGVPLLAGGSQYASSVEGRADQVHFRGGILRATNLLDEAGAAVRAGLFFMHAWSLVRAAAHMLEALAGSVLDALLARSSAQLGPGLRSAPGHIRRSVLLRDLTASGVAIDATRGVPTIHLSFLGYRLRPECYQQDLQRARRAALGIDKAIKQVWLAARRSPRRDYDIWIYAVAGSCANQSPTGNPGRPADLAGFALLPADAPISPPEATGLRMPQVRAAALHHLGRGPLPVGARPAIPSRAGVLRVMTYNVHSCIGMDGKLSPARIARVISRCNADVVALQELDVGRSRTGAIDQAHAIAELLSMEFHFHPALELEEERYGDAVLSRFPMRLVRAGPLPGVATMPHLEPRGALWVTIDTPEGPVQLINTHLGLVAQERAAQAEALLSSEWLAHEGCSGPTVLCGDFNALPRSLVCRRLCSRLADVQLALAGHRPKHTFFTRYPIGRIDHVFVSEHLEVLAVEVPRDDLIRRASDHLPLVAELRLRAPG